MKTDLEAMIEAVLKNNPIHIMVQPPTIDRNFVAYIVSGGDYSSPRGLSDGSSGPHKSFREAVRAYSQTCLDGMRESLETRKAYYDQELKMLDELRQRIEAAVKQFEEAKP